MQDSPKNQTTEEALSSADNEVPAPESMPSTEELLRQAELQAQEHHDAWLRAKAEMENVRRRAQLDVQNAHKFGVESFASALLPVKDSLEAALATQSNTVENIRSGVELTLKQLAQAFDKFTLTEINPGTGDKFDPHRHQAMSMVEAEQPANTIVTVFQKGYALHDRVVRPALVCVAKAKDA
jgi:molecular chaperone GrpE